MKANELKTGESGMISHVELSGLRNKLTEMGCFEGNTITRLYTAPLGDPIAYDISGYILGLRREEAALIEIRQENNDV